MVLALGLAWTGALTFLIVRFPRIASQLSTAGSSLLAGFAVFALVTTLHLVRATLWRPGPQSFTSTIPAANPQKPRLIWIVFDELAYKSVFEARDPSLKLPNFDRAARREHALHRRDADRLPDDEGGPEPATGPYRDGCLVHRGQPLSDPDRGRSSLGAIQRTGFALWHGEATRSHHFDCGVVRGLLPRLREYRNGMLLEQRRRTGSWTYATRCQLCRERVVSPARAGRADHCFAAPGPGRMSPPADTADGHIASVKDVSRHALQTHATRQADIIYLHIPAPHPPAFWDRRTGKYAAGGSYLDSLDYSDRLLGQILNLLEAQPRWAATTLIVHGDHSWRTAMWRPLPGWSAEDERISQGGQWDPRPLLMIHEPGQHSAPTVAAPTSLMLVHDTVAAKIQSLSK